MTKQSAAIQFEMVGGSACLDFTNTVSGAHTRHPRERLKNYDMLVEWARQARLLRSPEALKLRRIARRSSQQAANAFARGVRLRRALYAIFAAVAAGQAVPAKALALLNRELLDATIRMRLVTKSRRFERQLIPEASGLLLPVHSLARDATRLLTSVHLSRVRECAAPGCSWLFLDTSRNRSRTWCDMSVCGNRAKQARHRRRRQGRGFSR